MGDKILRVAFARNPPDAYANCHNFPTLNPTVQCAFPGWCIEIISYLAQQMNLKIEVALSQNIVGSLDWGTLLDNGTWTGVLGMLENNTADTACLFFQRTTLREDHYDFSYPVTNVQPIYAVRRQVESIGSILFNAFKPYSTISWIVILSSFLLQTIVMVGISKVETKMEKRAHFRPFEMIWHCVQLQLDEGSEDMRFHTIGGNFLLFVFSLLQTGFFIYLYEGLLLTALLQHGDANPFRDADGMIKLIAQGQYKLTTNYLGNWYFDELRNSNSTHFVSLREATANNPVVKADNVSHALDLVEQGNFIFPIQEDSLALQMSKERCNLVYVSEGLPQRSAHFVLSNHSRFLRRMEQAILLSGDFITRTYNKYFTEGFKIVNIPKCDTEEFDVQASAKPLDITSVIGIFTLGAIGVLLSAVAFVGEWYYFVHCKILDRRRKAKDIFFDQLTALARVHFTETNRTDNIDIMKLVEVMERGKETEKVAMT